MRNFFSNLQAVAGTVARYIFLVPLQATIIAVPNAAALVDAAAIALATAGNISFFRFVAASNAVRVFGVPTGMSIEGARIMLTIYNTSGGALTNTTFNAGIKQPAAVTYPANGFHREYFLTFDGTNWSLSFSGQDIAN